MDELPIQDNGYPIDETENPQITPSAYYDSINERKPLFFVKKVLAFLCSFNPFIDSKGM